MLNEPIQISPSPEVRVDLPQPVRVRTGGLRYIGSKARVAGRLAEAMKEQADGATFVDAFSGTGVVSKAMLPTARRIHVNDILQASAVMATAELLATRHVDFSELGSYEMAIDALNHTDATEEPGFIELEYSPSNHTEFNRLYFTEKNAKRIDAVRATIESWSKEGIIGITEKMLLLADLLAAANVVANTAGTYGCYLRSWQPNARKALQLRPRPLATEARELVVSAKPADRLDYETTSVAYFDPPYTKRQYAAYYHILETITCGDTPQVGGITGLRPWKNKASEFCYKKRALQAFWSLFEQCKAQHIFISYSSEGHVALEDLKRLAQQFGRVQVHNLGVISRYTPNVASRQNATTVNEYLIQVDS